MPQLLSPQTPSLVLCEILAPVDALAHQRAPVADIVSRLDAVRFPLCEYFRGCLGDSVAAQAITLKILNLLLAKYHFIVRSTVLHSRPFGLLVDPSNGCNLACPGCVHSTGAKLLRLFDWDKGMLSGERFRALLECYGPYAVQIMFCNYGEPTTNLNTPHLIKMAKSYLLQTTLSTNLTIGRFDAEAYVQSGLDFMYASIDGASQAVYERFRKNGNIEAVFRNLRNLVEAKRRLNSPTPVVRWQFLAFEHNAQEIPMALAIAREIGVDQFAVETPFDVTWDDPRVRPASGVRPFCLELEPGVESKLSGNCNFQLSGTAAETIERAFGRGWSGSVNASWEPELVSEHTCSWLYKNMVMDANGRIIPCCASPRPDIDLVFANFPQADTDCFNSEAYQRARLYFADRLGYERSSAPAGGSRRDPHCVNCDWDQSHTEVGPHEVARYLRTAGQGHIDEAVTEMLSNW